MRILKSLEVFVFDWNDFGNTLVATLAGAIIATVFSMWLTRRERPRPMWRLEDVSGKFGLVTDNYAYSQARVINIGNGDAYNVRVTIKGADPYEAPTTTHIVRPGDSVPAHFCFGLLGEVEHSYPPEGMTDNRVPVWPANAHVLVEWQQPPSLRRVKQRKFTIGPLPIDWNGEKLWPKDIP